MDNEELDRDNMMLLELENQEFLKNYYYQTVLILMDNNKILNDIIQNSFRDMLEVEGIPERIKKYVFEYQEQSKKFDLRCKELDHVYVHEKMVEFIEKQIEFYKKEFSDDKNIDEFIKSLEICKNSSVLFLNKAKKEDKNGKKDN